MARIVGSPALGRPDGAVGASRNAVLLAALYLPGYPGPTPAPTRWNAVAAAIRASAATDWPEVADRLRRQGHRLEAFVLEDEARRLWASRAVAAGKVLTAMDAGYPSRWLERLGSGAPPALWRRSRGAGPGAGPWISVVGTRAPTPADRWFAEAVAREAVRLGYGVGSGAAPGTDRAALRGLGAGAETLEVLPCGLAAAARAGFPVSARTALSLAEPSAPFSGPMAMRRNALVYALGQATIVVRARFKVGGTWNGAIEALRRRLGPILVRRDDDDAAHRALIALGGVPLADPAELEAALCASPSQGSLFSALG